MDPALTTTPYANQTSIRGGAGRTRVPAVRHSTSIYRCLWLDERGSRVHVEEEIDERWSRFAARSRAVKGLGSLDWLGFFTGLLTKARDGGRPTLG
jgi:hypothetical protein